MLLRLFPVVVFSAALFCVGLAQARVVKPVPSPSAAMDGSGGSQQRGERDKDREKSRLIRVPTQATGAAGGGSHTDRDL